MVDEQRPHDATISSEDTITTATITTIEEDDLDLSLSLRPLHCSSTSSPSSHHSKTLPEPSSNAPNNLILSKRDAQALRRHEAKLKRDLKRKSSSSASSMVNDVVGIEQPRKVHNLGFQGSPPPWLTWNADCANVGLWPCQGYTGNFASHNEGASISCGSSSGISDNYQCISGPGGHSSDAGSHSSHPHSPLPPTNGPTCATTLLQPCSLQLDLEFNGSNPNHSKPQFCCSHSNKTELLACSRQPSVSPEGLSSLNMTSQQNGARPNNEKTLTDKDPNSTPRSTMPKEAKTELGKPPKPVGLIDQQKVLVSQMPCVSTTGNGPNGKTITGFLYKYTKAEVSIICVCHGASFSPAGFVEHAGSVDVEFPLKHIRVVPFALG